jgi:selenide,water dikinase
MGGTPLFALNLTVWPRDRLPLELLADVLAGGSEVADAGGWVVAGGHTVDGEEPMYGQAVLGEVDPDAVLTNANATPGEALVLTKPLGTGLVATMVKRCDPAVIAPGGEHAASYGAAVAEMTRLNDVAARVAREAGARAATDVTGFGLLGHLQRLAAASGVSAHVDLAEVPVLPDAWALLDAGYVPGGTRRNLDYVREHVTVVGEGIGERELTLLADAQTSGGLLFGCPPEAADDAVAELRVAGHAAARIGHLGDGPGGSVRVSATQ